MKYFIVMAFFVYCLGLEAQVVGWRVDGTGKYPNAPSITEWSADKGILWKVPTKSWSNATPIVVGNKVFICEEPFTLVCLSAVDGKELWRKTNSYEELFTEEQRKEAAEKEKQVAELEKKKAPLNKKNRELSRQSKKEPDNKALKDEMGKLKDEIKQIDGEIRKLSKLLKPKTHNVNGYSSQTPVSDGKNVFVLFGTGVLSAFDLDGNRQWIKQLPKPKNAWGTSASPLLNGGKLLINIADTVIALNPSDGKELWQAKAKSAWGSLIACKLGTEDAVITGAGDLISTSDGKVVANTIAQIPWQTPIVENGILYVVDEKGAYAVKLPSSAADKPQTLWKQAYSKPRKDRYYAAPLLYQDLLYAVNRLGYLSVLDAKTGELVYEEKTGLKNDVYPSPALVGENILLSDPKGKTIILKPGRLYVKVRENSLEDFRSCPVVYNDKLFIRGLKHLYCIGK